MEVEIHYKHLLGQAPLLTGCLRREYYCPCEGTFHLFYFFKLSLSVKVHVINTSPMQLCSSRDFVVHVSINILLQTPGLPLQCCAFL